MTTTIFRLTIDLVAQYFVVLYTPVFAFWLIIHSQIRYWRRMGKTAYWIACMVWPICGIPILIYRKRVFAIRFPTPWWTIALGFLFALLAVRMGWLAFRNISRRTLVGLPELEPGKNIQPLLNTGIYARTRNPIYFMHSLAIVALALLTGFAANWALLALDILLMPPTIRAEERELIGRYGEAYLEYMRTVPDFSQTGHGRISGAMVIGLLTASLLSIVCFLYTAWLGFAVHGSAGVGNHFLYGFFTTFLVTLAQSMTMFFFIGTGKQVKELVVNDEKGPEFVKRTKQFKAKTFPPMLWAMLFTMATMIVGGGVHTQVMPSLHLAAVHGVLATIALYYNLVATWRNAKYMIEHNMLMEEVEKRLVASPASK